MTAGFAGPLPHNRWDLLPLQSASPAVSVVVLHYRQAEDLTRLLAALEVQTLRPAEVIVTDDGSPERPRPQLRAAPIRVVTQSDLGFRAARARNRGADAARGDVLVFLDADCVPTPRALEALVRRVAAHPDVLAVGRRRHADLRTLRPGGDPASMRPFDDPVWLADGYRSSANLLHADGRSFRYVLSAVMACGRVLFDDIGRFDERYEGYGGEDWDLAYRAWNNGAVLVHEPEAVVWHNGPDPSQRSGIGLVRNRQAMRLAGLIPEPLTRGAALPHDIPDLLVDIEVGDDVVDQVKAIHSIARQTHRDLAVRIVGPLNDDLRATYGDWLRTDWSPDQLRRARAHLLVHGPLPTRAVEQALTLAVEGDLGVVDLCTGGALVATMSTTRLVGRRRRWSGTAEPAAVGASLGRGNVDLGPVDPGPANLEDWLAATAVVDY